MRQIKIILITLYCIILGFIVFCNTSVFGADGYLNQTGVYDVTQGIDLQFINTQDLFDNFLVNSNKDSLQDMTNYLKNILFNYGNGDYFVVPYYNTSSDRGYRVYIYSLDFNRVEPTSIFYRGVLENYHSTWTDIPQDLDTYMQFTGMKVNSFRHYDIYNFGNSCVRYDTSEDIAIPLSCYGYPHQVFIDNFNSATNGGQITSAINNQTNTIKNESAKVTGAIENQTQATKEQTNQLLDTNNTGNETMSVNDTTSDTSANLGGLYNQIDDAFTSDAVILYDSHTFNLTLPNGDSFPIVLRTQFFRSFLDNNPVFKAFYQSIFWVIFGGYVIFDFKKIINKMKEGNIDNVVGSSNPVDSVVNMSLK